MLNSTALDVLLTAPSYAASMRRFITASYTEVVNQSSAMIHITLLSVSIMIPIRSCRVLELEVSSSRNCPTSADPDYALQPTVHPSPIVDHLRFINSLHQNYTAPIFQTGESPSSSAPPCMRLPFRSLAIGMPCVRLTRPILLHPRLFSMRNHSELQSL